MLNPGEQGVLDELRVDLIPAKQKAKWDRPVRQRHYLKSARLVGEQLRYVVTDARGRWLVLIGWCAAALHLKARDQLDLHTMSAALTRVENVLDRIAPRLPNQSGENLRRNVHGLRRLMKKAGVRSGNGLSVPDHAPSDRE